MPGALRPDLGLSIDELVEELDRNGFVCVEDVVSDDWLSDAREDVRDNLARYGENDFCIIHPDSRAGSPAQRFVTAPEVRALLEQLARARCPRGVSDREPIYSVLRVLAGPDRAATSFAFHYDAAVVTMLVPLAIPSVGAGRSGELVVFPNRRPFRRSVLVNIAEKIWVQNPFRRKRLAREFDRDPGRAAVVLRPGNAYLFWGYRTLHGNLPCAPGTVRATLLLHFGDPHGGSVILRAVKRLRAHLAPSSEHTEATVVRL